MIFFAKNINKYSFNFFILAFFTLLFTFCHTNCRKKENAFPVISVNSPANNQTFTVGDTIQIKGYVSDDKLVNNISVSIVDAQSISISSSENYTINKEYSDFSIYYCPIITEALNSESYSLKISAFDGELFSRQYVSILLSEKPLQKTGYLILTRKDDFSTYIGLYDNSLNEVSRQTINDVAKTIEIDYSENSFFYYGISSGKLIASNTNDLTEKWQISEVNNFKAGYLSKMKLLNNLLFVSHQNARINAYDKYGNIRKSAQLNDLNYETGIFNKHNEFLVCFSNNIYQNRIECINYETGSPIRYKVIDYDAIGIEGYNNEKVLIFGNKDNIAKVCTLDVYQNIIYEIPNFPQGTLKSITKLSESEFLLLIDNKIYIFNKTNNNISLFGTFANSQYISYDSKSDELRVIENDKLQIYNFGNSQLLIEKMFGYSVYEIVAVYSLN
ncbi:MAG: hypothetical protein A2046_03295 [Bacteroidetes bacterium GWA2_30_7]|nr:MAG: hypothetical protein A2046_03295 [Bacteroidetes bacterium GWA2_30_7]